MAIFGRKTKNLIQQAQQGSWTNLRERQELVTALKQAKISASDAVVLLWSRDSDIRQIAVESFLSDPSVGALRTMVEQMVEQPAHVRSFAARLVPKLDRRLVEKVIDGLLADKNPVKQRQGWELALELTGEAGARYLSRATREAPGELRITALQRLVKDTDPRPHVDLLLKLARDPERRLAAIAVEALSKVQEKRVLDLMLDAFAHGDATSRNMAKRYLETQTEANPAGMRRLLLELLGEGEDAIRRMSVELLLQTGDHSAVLLEILVYARNLVGWLRDRILETLRGMGDEVLQNAVGLLQHEDEDVRTAALVLVQYFRDPRVVLPVCKMLEDDDWWLRITACDALGELGDKRAVPQLVKALQDEDARWAAIDALARIGAPEALKPMSALLRDKRPEVRGEVVRAFGRFEDPRLLPLLKQLKDKDPVSEIRTRAAEVLRDLSAKLGKPTEDTEARTTVVSTDQLKRPLDKLLARIRQEGYSDLHITVGEPPFVRRGGVLERLEGGNRLDARQTQGAILSILSDRHKRALQRVGEVDFCHAIPEVGRYRVNAFVQRKGLCAAFRVIPNVPPTFSDLRLPGRLTELTDYHQGIIVVSGPAASGKSTTLAAIINLINETAPDHIITLEDPIEFVHPAKLALVNQREVGSHSESFSRALRASLRQDPDVIMVGEMRDVETIRMALMAAETGHLVVATMHTTSAVQTIDRLVGSFPPEEQPQVRMALSESLKYVVCQQLLPRKDGKGRVAVFEVLKGIMSVGNLLRDSKTYQIPSLMQIGRHVGMQTVDQALMDLVEADLIEPEAAWLRAEKAETFAPLCRPSFLREVEAV